MNVEMHNFQKHTEVRWLSLGSSVLCILEQGDCICSFVKDLGKDSKTAPKSASYKRVVTQLELIGNVSPVFEEFLTIFQRSCPQVHILYDKMCKILHKLIPRFLKKETYEKEFGSELVSVDYSAHNQLPDLDIAIADAAKKALAQVKLECHKSILGIHTFYSTSVEHFDVASTKLLQQLLGEVGQRNQESQSPCAQMLLNLKL